MTERFKPIELSCPSCGAVKAVKIPESLFFDKKFGHIKVQVPQGAVCPDHVFVVFFDVKARIIGYEAIDLSISTTIEEPKEAIIDESLKTMTLVELIKSLGFNCIAGLIHAKLFDYPSFVIMNNGSKVKLDEINNVLDKLIPDMYKTNRSLKTIEFDDEIFPMATYFYSLVQKQNKNAFLMNPRKHVIQMPWELDLELEKSIIRSALEKKNQNEQLKFLAYYIAKFIEDVEFTISLLEDVKKISKKELIKQLKSKLLTSTITKNRVNEIKDFIKKRISDTIANKIQG
ncbi:MAG: hypothetical protein ACFE8L_12345 [Candidatus Hodarchaeota archaeon]